MLKDNLYSLVSLEEKSKGSYQAKVSINSRHAVFKGHFPEQPVLPGVCLLEMVKEILAEIKNKPCQLKKAAQIKYLKIVDPTIDSVLRFEMEVVLDGSEYKVNVSSFLQDGSSNFKLKGTFA